MNFFENLQHYRKLKGFSRQYMAEKLNIKPVSYANYEQGRTKPDVEKLSIISDILNVSPNELLGNNSKQIDDFEYCKSLWKLDGYKIEENEITGMIEVLFNSTVITVENGIVKKKTFEILPFKNKEEFIKLTHYIERQADKEKEKARSKIFKTVIQNSQKIAKHQVIEEKGIRTYSIDTGANNENIS